MTWGHHILSSLILLFRLRTGGMHGANHRRRLP